MPEVKRSTRIAERVRQELSMLLLSGSTRHPMASELVITHVRVTDDLSLARVYIRLLDSNCPAATREAAVNGLERAAGFLRAQIGKALHVRRTPTLEFFWDKAIDDAQRIDQLLAEVREEGESQ
jgi:ribosome-binding factor A